jgi:hypothetical protein
VLGIYNASGLSPLGTQEPIWWNYVSAGKFFWQILILEKWTTVNPKIHRQMCTYLVMLDKIFGFINKKAWTFLHIWILILSVKLQPKVFH